MTDKKIKLAAVVGPTASGKTALAIELAQELDGEIISCDSMQIYRGMDIGTAKPTREELCAVPHHLIDILPPDAPYSCSDYVRDAEAAIEDVTSRGKLPILCGGTGLYLDRLLRGGVEDSAASDENLRQELWDFYQKEGADALYARLHITKDEAMAFGDYLNDYELLENVTHSYAMANAHPKLKAIAAHIAPSNDEDGVMRVIKETVLSDEIL